MLAKKITIFIRSPILIIFIAVISQLLTQTVRADSAPLTDDGFVHDAFLSNQIEIEISRIALEKSSNAGIKKLAKAIIKDQSSANTQLRTLAETKNLPVPQALDSNNQLQVDKFKNVNVAALDASYRLQIQQHHEAAIVLYERVAKNPRSDAELRVFAFKMLPILHKHQQTLAKNGAAAPNLASRNNLH